MIVQLFHLAKPLGQEATLIFLYLAILSDNMPLNADGPPSIPPLLARLSAQTLLLVRLCMSNTCWGCSLL